MLIAAGYDLAGVADLATQVFSLFLRNCFIDV